MYNFCIFLYALVSDPSNFPTLWIGTSVGSVLTIMINLPPPGEPRTTQPVTVAPCGEFFLPVTHSIFSTNEYEFTIKISLLFVC